MFISFLYIYFKNFSKKLISLLSLEMLMIVLIFSFSFLQKNSFNSISYIFLVFLIMMVLDSVLGICILIFSSRYSSKYHLEFF